MGHQWYAHGVSLTTYNKFVSELEFLFTKDFSNWQPIDNACRKYSIDLLIFSDLTAKPPSSPRSALYENEYYSIFTCGNYAKIK
ncbi:hypothetical protein [Candidatus Villigracilis affinis]|uniref:hypothetical protein n=1 Tax=Candidatus Villigracilis affinis TaxID=3140682 RepID=UPI002A1B4DD7|nr:hypothetical protein [Anaerolineales bacterium]